MAYRLLNLCISISFLIYTVASVSAVTITGEFYDTAFEEIPHAVISLNTTPPSQQVFYSEYSIELDPGSYLLTATTFVEGQQLKASESIVIPPQPDSDVIQRDLVFFPDFEESLALTRETIPETSTLSEAYTEFSYDPFNIIFILLWAIVIFFIFRSFTALKKKETPPSENGIVQGTSLESELEELRKTISSQPTRTLSPEVQKIYTSIRSEGQISQKELLKKFPMSAAKLSLIITELEHMGLITKIKKGRGNTIVCNE